MIDDFEHHQSWRFVAVAEKWEVLSHSHQAEVGRHGRNLAKHNGNPQMRPMMKNDEHHPLLQIAALLLGPTGSALAAWIQTVAVVVGLYFAVGQLHEMAAQTQSSRNQQYDALLQKYEAEAGEAISQVRSVGAWVQQGNWSAQDIDKAIAQLELKHAHSTRAIVELQLKHLDGLRKCAAREVCPAEKVRDFVCRDAGRTFLALSAKPAPGPWKL